MMHADGTFEEGPMHVLDSRDYVLRHKTVMLVKVLWQHRGLEERRQHGNARTRCVPDISSCLRMEVCDLVIEY